MRPIRIMMVPCSLEIPRHVPLPRRRESRAEPRDLSLSGADVAQCVPSAVLHVQRTLTAHTRVSPPLGSCERVRVGSWSGSITE